LALSKSLPAKAFAVADEYHSDGSGAPENAEKKPVSYTHLTLPTT
jgi:hypothetical protein